VTAGGHAETTGEGGVSVAEVRQSAVRRASESVDAYVGAVFAVVEAVRAEVRDLLDAALTQQRAPSRADLQPLEPSLRAALDDGTRPRLAGLGYIAAVDVLRDRPRWLEWVRRAEDGSLARLEPDLDPESFGFYDFTAADWFRQPLVRGGRSVVGPYVDFAGTDEYVVTFTVPIVNDTGVLGVAGADLRPGDLADAVMSPLCAIGADAVLVNADDRIVVSNTSRWPVGSLLREPLAAAREDCRQAPWSVLAFEGSLLV
jgi:hypothetical protein